MKLYSIIAPYLLLVTFASGQLNDFNIDKINTINVSPFNGVAVELTNAYDTATYKKEDFEKSISLLKKESRKQIWPWVFFNRFIGFDPGTSSASPRSDQPYFRKIKGIDIDNKTGALQDFYDIWKIALITAKELGSPGVLIDPEAYNNNRKGYRLDYIAGKAGVSREKLIEKLKAIGKHMVDIALATYPEATIWCTSIGLTHYPKYFGLGMLRADNRRTVTYIIVGMLERAKEKEAALKIVSGGLLSIGYCPQSLENLKSLISLRENRLASFLATYPNLHLGAPVAPWDKPELKKGWMREGACGKSNFQKADDFEPLMRYLFRYYKYVWIYAASAAPYNPYEVSQAAVFNRVIKNALRSAPHGD
jgi:hypothetical protein